MPLEKISHNASLKSDFARKPSTWSSVFAYCNSISYCFFHEKNDNRLQHNCPFKKIMLHQVRGDMKSCRIITTGGTSMSPTKKQNNKKEKTTAKKKFMFWLSQYNVKAIGPSPVNPISLRQFSAINSKLEEPQLIVLLSSIQYCNQPCIQTGTRPPVRFQPNPVEKIKRFYIHVTMTCFKYTMPLRTSLSILESELNNIQMSKPCICMT